jgi:hypothetical protein
MSYKVLFILNALIALVFGLAFLVVPTMALQQFEVDEYASTKLVLQFFGTGLLTIGLLAWFAKNVSDAGIQKGMGIGMLIGSLAGLAMSMVGVANGLIRNFSWLPMVIYGVFALGYGFMLFLKPRMKEARNEGAKIQSEGVH